MRGAATSEAPYEAGENDTSEFMIGSVAVGIILPESDGTINSNLENWTTEEENLVMGGIENGLKWWANKEPNAELSFVCDNHFRVPTSYEPITHPAIDENLWIDNVMTQLGYPGDNIFLQVLSYLNDLRTTKGTDWAVAIFVVDDTNDEDHRFADNNYFAYAYRGGPFIVMTCNNYDWGIDHMDCVTSHEMGHSFYASDEHNIKDPEYSGYENVPDQDFAWCMMDLHSDNVCTATRGQIGWWDNDNDNILNIMDTLPYISLTPYSPDPTDDSTPTYYGTANVVPLSNKNPYGPRNDITLQTIANVQYRVDNGAWENATPTDGAFDEQIENFTFTTPLLSENATHVIEARAINSVGNDNYASDSLFVNLTTPQAPELVSPDNNATIEDNTPTFAWENVTDPSGVTYTLQYSTDPSFPSPPEDWLGAAWSYRRKITIDHSKVDNNLENFPVAVILDNTNFDFSKARPDGYDIRFTASDGETLLKYERERHDSVNQKAEYWVKIPSVSSSTDTEFYAYYGKSNALDGAEAENVWDSNYVAVYHMKEESGTVYDSTDYGNHSTSRNGCDLEDAKIGKGFDFIPTDYYNVPDSNSLDITGGTTVETWGRPHDIQDWKVFLYKGDVDVTVTNYLIQYHDPWGYLFRYTDLASAVHAWRSNQNPSVNDWNYNAFVYTFGTASTAKLYQNDNWYAGEWYYGTGNGVVVGNPESMRVGDQKGSWPYDGELDELRISKIKRSDEWIKASYNSDNNTLVSYGSEEASGGARTIEDLSENTYTVSNNEVLADNAYYWRVRAVDGSGNLGGWSETWKFKIDTTPPPAPELISPDNNTTIENNTPTFAWENVDDPSGVTYTIQYSTDPSFPSPPADWFDTAWSYRKRITIDHDKVDNNLENFPVAVILDNTNFDFSKARPDGYDIRFTASDGTTLLKYERERHDNDNQKAEYWVKIPSVSSSANTEFYMYYGKSNAVDGVDPTNVWDSNYVAVYHMKESSGTVHDSTSNGDNSTSRDGCDLLAAKIGEGFDFVPTDYFDVPDSSSLDLTGGITIEAWAAPDSITAYKVFLFKGNAAFSQVNYYGEFRTSRGFIFEYVGSGGSNAYESGTEPTLGSWNYTGFVYTFGTAGSAKTYQNGNWHAGDWYYGTGNVSAITNSESLRIGDQKGCWPYDGKLDELRISKIKRSDAWIKASYNSENNTLVSYASENASYLTRTIEDLSENMHTVPNENALADNTYYWHVWAVDGVGHSSESDVWQFTVDTTP